MRKKWFKECKVAGWPSNNDKLKYQNHQKEKCVYREFMKKVIKKIKIEFATIHIW